MVVHATFFRFAISLDMLARNGERLSTFRVVFLGGCPSLIDNNFPLFRSQRQNAQRASKTTSLSFRPFFLLKKAPFFAFFLVEKRW